MTKPCGAKTRSGGKCKQAAGWGTDHAGVGCCKLHGGSLPNHRASAALIIEERDARTMLEKLGVPQSSENPVKVLLATLVETQAWQAILRERVSELYALTTEDKMEVEREKALVLLYERALDRTSKIAAEMIRLKLDERRVAIDEMQTEMVFRALQAALAGLPKQYQEPARERLVLALRKEDKV